MIIISFTEEGTRLNAELSKKICQMRMSVKSYAVARFAVRYSLSVLPENPIEWIGTLWGDEACLFIGAAGIAVRYIAPWVKDKLTDSPVIVMDEKGEYVIPVLSGHAGGGIALAEEIAKCTGATPVLTTATDVQKKFAVDVFAGKNRLKILDRVLAKKISAAVLEGKKIGFYSTFPVEGQCPGELKVCDRIEELENYCYGIAIVDKKVQQDKENILWLWKKREIVAGIGCRKGTKKEQIKEGLLEVLEKNRIKPDEIAAFASIDLKEKEEGLLKLAEEYKVSFITYSADELKKTGSVSQGSSFVEKVTGVDNVCERAARCCVPEGELIQPKVCSGGITVALAEKKEKLSF